MTAPDDSQTDVPAAERSFEVLAADYRPMLECYLKGITGESHLAEDLTQETFLVALKQIDRFEPGGNFGAWLRGIARNKVREHRRSAARRPLLVDSRIVEGMEQVYSLFDAPGEGGGAWGDRLQVVRECIGKLRSKLRGAIESVYLRGKTLGEAAQELDSKPEAVGQRLSRARRLIRECAQKNSPNVAKGGGHG